MSYNINTQEYTCDICGFTGKFDAHDEAHGDLWGCEECEDTFCSKCFTDKFGDREFDRMLKQSDKVLCPACWKKRRQEILSNSESPAYISREIVEDLLERAQIISDGENSGYCTEDVPIREIPVADVVPFAKYKKTLLENRALYASEKNAKFWLNVITNYGKEDGSDADKIAETDEIVTKPKEAIHALEDGKWWDYLSDDMSDEAMNTLQDAIDAAINALKICEGKN